MGLSREQETLLKTVELSSIATVINWGLFDFF
jgi:hypothetical protein